MSFQRKVGPYVISKNFVNCGSPHIRGIFNVFIINRKFRGLRNSHPRSPSTTLIDDRSHPTSVSIQTPSAPIQHSIRRHANVPILVNANRSDAPCPATDHFGANARDLPTGNRHEDSANTRNARPSTRGARGGLNVPASPPAAMAQNRPPRHSVSLLEASRNERLLSSRTKITGFVVMILLISTVTQYSVPTDSRSKEQTSHTLTQTHKALIPLLQSQMMASVKLPNTISGSTTYETPTTKANLWFNPQAPLSNTTHGKSHPLSTDRTSSRKSHSLTTVQTTSKGTP